MQTMFNLPQYSAVFYKQNPQTGYYTKTQEQPTKRPVMRLPYELRITPTRAEKIKCNARELIVSRERSKTGSYRFITGIHKTDFHNWYLGNDYEFYKGAKVISIVLFQFNEDNSQLTVYYFSRYDRRNTDERLRFANAVIPALLKPLLV